MLLLAFGLLAAFCISQRRFGNSAAVPLALAIGTCVAAAFEGNLMGRTWRRPGWRVLAGGALLIAALAGGAVSASNYGRSTPAETVDLAEWRFERLAGMQWMRANTPCTRRQSA